MISKQNRISRQDFEIIMKKGGLVSSPFFNCRFIKNPENISSASWRISVVISKKVAKTAVLRNKIRRRAYSVLKNSTKNPSPASGYIILFAKKGVEKATFSETKEAIQDILIKAKII